MSSDGLRSPFLGCTTSASILASLSSSSETSYATTSCSSSAVARGDQRAPAKSTNIRKNIRRRQHERHHPVMDTLSDILAAQEDFLCGSPGGQNESGRDMNQFLFQILAHNDRQSTSTSNSRNIKKIRAGCLFDEREKDCIISAQADAGDGGIEVDAESSLLPAYGLYRV